MSKYESVFIARQDFSTAQVEALNEKLTQTVEGLGGKVAKTEYWGLRSLAYRVKKNRKGHYTLFQIEADNATIAEYERQMRLNEDVLRQMTVKVEEFEEEQSAILRNRDERGGRGGNRRGEFNKLNKTSGTSWDYGAISNAKWGGILLKDLFMLVML